jgi:hypothetical protein
MQTICVKRARCATLNLTMRTHAIQTKVWRNKGDLPWQRKKIAVEFAFRYRKAGKHEKSRIPDGYLTLTGSKSRKYALFKSERDLILVRCLMLYPHNPFYLRNLRFFVIRGRPPPVPPCLSLRNPVQ